MTRVGKISPLWQNVKSLWPFLKGSFTSRKNFEPTLAIFMALGKLLETVPNIEKLIQPSGHTDGIIRVTDTKWEKNIVY